MPFDVPSIAIGASPMLSMTNMTTTNPKAMRRVWCPGADSSCLPWSPLCGCVPCGFGPVPSTWRVHLPPKAVACQALVVPFPVSRFEKRFRGVSEECIGLQRAAPLGLCFLRRFRLAGGVEGDGLANERLEGRLVNFFSFVDVDRAACVSVETRVEETGRIFERRAPGEGKLHDILVGLAGADDAVVRPHRITPLPLLDDVRVCFLDELAHSAEGFPAPVTEFSESFRDELGCRLAWARARLFHVLLLSVADRSYQLRTRSARSVFHRLGRLSPSSSAKWTLPGCVFSSSQVPSACRLDRSKSMASSIRESGTSPAERKYSRARSTS